MCWVSRAGKDMTIVGGVEWSTDGAVGRGVSQSTWIEATALSAVETASVGALVFHRASGSGLIAGKPNRPVKPVKKDRLHTLCGSNYLTGGVVSLNLLGSTAAIRSLTLRPLRARSRHRAAPTRERRRPGKSALRPIYRACPRCRRRRYLRSPGAHTCPGLAVRARQYTSTRRAPACRSRLARAWAVAPVVRTSSTMARCRPSTVSGSST